MDAGKPDRRPGRFSPVDRYGLALALVVVGYVQALLTPVSQGGTASVVLVQLLTVYVVLGISASRRVRRVAGVALAVSAALTVVTAVAGVVASDEVLLALFATNIVLYAVAPGVILRHVFKRRVVDGQTFLAAVCAYALIGMLFAFVYRAVGAYSGTSFFGATGGNTMPNFLFFSFITVTTTGYGNLVPAGTAGQSLAVLEAMAGQFFIAAVVAKIVTAWRPRWARKPGEGWDYEEGDPPVTPARPRSGDEGS